MEKNGKLIDNCLSFVRFRIHIKATLSTKDFHFPKLLNISQKKRKKPTELDKL